MVPAGFWNQCRSYCGHGSQCADFRDHPWVMHYDGAGCIWPDSESITEREADLEMMRDGVPVMVVIRDRMAEITYMAVYGSTFHPGAL